MELIFQRASHRKKDTGSEYRVEGARDEIHIVWTLLKADGERIGSDRLSACVECDLWMKIFGSNNGDSFFLSIYLCPRIFSASNFGGVEQIHVDSVAHQSLPLFFARRSDAGNRFICLRGQLGASSCECRRDLFSGPFHGSPERVGENLCGHPLGVSR